MSAFDIAEEHGYSRRLVSNNVPDTPWLLTTNNGLKLGEIKINQFILSERGLLPLRTPGTPSFTDQAQHDKIVEDIPNWAVLTPRLYPASDTLEKSLQYELNLYLDRLEQIELPTAFGLVYDPSNSHKKHLQDLLQFKPSFLVLRYPAVERISPRTLTRQLLSVRKKVPPNIALYLPAGGSIGFQTLLVALGIDILDDMAAYRSASKHLRFFDGIIEYSPELDYNELITQNLRELRSDFNAIKYHLVNNTLWTRLAREMHTHPNIASSVNILGRDLLEQIEEERFPKFTENKLQFTGEEGLYHPDVVAYRKRTINRYKVQNHSMMVILLPCSAKKPYIESHSHHFYEKAIKEGAEGNYEFVNVWSLTSPLGVVPRELERVYPAQNYDIPVTGHWSDEEIEITGSMLGEMLRKLPENTKIIVHVSEDYRKMIEYANQFREMDISWIGDAPRSNDALNTLRKAIQVYFSNKDTPFVDGKRYYRITRNTIQAITRFNHGLKVSLDFDSDSVRIVGRPPRPQQIQKNKQHWITWDSINGEVRLSHRAIQEIALDSDNWILVGTNKLRGSNLFNIGVIDASDKISPGDEVVFFNETKSILLGVGVATISGKSMKVVNSGPAASIRKKLQIDVEELQ